MKAFLFVSISCFVVNHVGVVGRFLRAAVLAREREDCGACATLNRRVKPKRRKRFVEAGPAVDDDKFGGLKSRMRLSSNARQAASLSPPMFLDRKQHLLAIAAHAKRYQQRDEGRLLVEADAHNRAV